MLFKKSILPIGKNVYTVVQFFASPPKEKKILMNRLHFIQVLDRSASMANHIDTLIENVKKTIDAMNPDDLMSVVWFSGPNQYKVLLKGASPSEPGLKNQLEKLKSTLGTTCFSEAMTEVRDIMEDLWELCSNFVVTLFTDGTPDVPWPIEEEEHRTQEILSACKERLLSFNTIGYGEYYNVDFLKSLAALSKFGRHAHSSRMEQYLPIFKHNLKMIENLSEAQVDVLCPGNTALYLSRKTSRLAKDQLNLNLSHTSTNKFYIIHPSKDDFQFQIDGKTFHSSSIKGELSTKNIEDLLYTFAYERYYEGNTSEALEILTSSLKDKALATVVLHSFTVKERQSCMSMLEKAAHDRKVNLHSRVWSKTRCLEGLLTENELLTDGPCFLELLEVFEKNGDKYIPLSPTSYRRIGRKVTDNYNAFKSDITAKLTANFKDLVFTKDRLNISIRYEIPGTVTINPRQAKAAALPTNRFNAKIFREQTLIKDGEVHIEKFHALVSEETLNYLRRINLRDLFTIAEGHDYPYTDDTLITLNVSRIPVVSKRYALENDNLDNVLDYCYEQRSAECKQKVLKYYLGNLTKCCRGSIQKYTTEQLDLLKSFGLDASGIYSGIDNQKEVVTTEQYHYRYFEFGLKGFSNLPKVDDVLLKLEDGKKKFNGPESIMASYILDLKENHYDTLSEILDKLLEEQRIFIKENTRKLATIKLSKILTGGWWSGLKLDDKEHYLYSKEGKTLVIKMLKKSVNI